MFSRSIVNENEKLLLQACVKWCSSWLFSFTKCIYIDTACKKARSDYLISDISKLKEEAQPATKTCQLPEVVYVVYDGTDG